MASNMDTVGTFEMAQALSKVCSFFFFKFTFKEAWVLARAVYVHPQVLQRGTVEEVRPGEPQGFASCCRQRWND